MLVTLALWALCRFGGASAWWAELLRFVPFPAFLAPPALALAASLWLRWPWRLAALGCLALVLADTMDLRWGQADVGSAGFRLMTWNVKAVLHTRAPDREQRVALELMERDADVIVMQDADDYSATTRELPDAIAFALHGRTLFRHGQYLVASRLPMRDCHAQPMPVQGDQRDFVRCTLTVDGTDIDLVTVHLISPRAGLNAARHEWIDGGLADWRENFLERLGQVDLLVRRFAGTPRPTILAGDFNAAEASPVLHSLESIGLRDAFGSAGRGYGFTHGHALRPGFSFLRIDHILVSPQIGVVRCEAGGRDASEHRPVIADLLARRG